MICHLNHEEQVSEDGYKQKASKRQKRLKLVADLPESSLHGDNNEIAILNSQIQSHPSGRGYSFMLFTYLYTHMMTQRTYIY
jgi:hypothetical protein